MKRQTPEINAGSMADIAFLLLIFWLVATSLKPDRGVLDTLENPEDVVKIAVPTSASDILRVYVNEDGEYEAQVNGTRILSLEEIGKFIVRLKSKSGYKAKLVLTAHYDAPYESYLLLLKLADSNNIKTIENKIIEDEQIHEETES